MTCDRSGNNTDSAVRTYVDFIARMTASASHELKNVLAIVNENAGLLDDLLLLAAKGKPLNPERLQRLAVNIHGQVQRGDEIVKRLSMLAHTVYGEIGLVDIREICENTVSLTVRLAMMQNIQVSMASGEPVIARIHPFLLANALWVVLSRLLHMASVSGQGRIELCPWQNGKTAVAFQIHNFTAVDDIVELIKEEDALALNAIHARLEFDKEKGLCLYL